MKAFKFLKSRDVHFLVERETLRLSTHAYFRTLEGSRWIADHTEGKIIQHSGDLYIGDTLKEPEITEKLKLLGVHIGGHIAGITVKDNVMRRALPPLFIFCCSYPPFELVRKAMCEDAPKGEEYDACLEISNLGALRNLIKRSTSLDGQRFSCLFTRIDGGECNYGITEGSLSKAEYVTVGDPFLKTEELKAQQEFRFVCYPRKVPQKEIITLHVPGMAKLLRRIL